ncbi:efflux RND transporter periplasmic adaptor subunit [Planctomycetota bacterium]
MEDDRKNKCSKAKRVKLVLIIIAAFIAGYIISSLVSPDADTTDDKPFVQQKWYCSMDPQIIRNGPGKCPICAMDLIPMPTDLAESAVAELVVSPQAAKLMDIQTSVVKRQFVTNEIRMVGKIEYDETRLKNITAWVSGRIDRLFVDFTGISVNKGDHMVEIYSPELISSQAELIQVSKSVSQISPGTSRLITGSTMSTLTAVREKLRLLGLSTEQIQQIETSGKTQTHITINSPISGIVIQRNAVQGMYVETGTRIYTIADLSRLWIKLDAYESDLPWIRFGQQVEFTTQAYPGTVFKGTISFIDPVLDDRTRTVKVRVNVDNSDGMLKPQMFVKAVVRSTIAAQGKVMTPEMQGKWICPMHPDIVKTEPGSCDICGMDLATTESLGYVKAETPKHPPLVIPASAVLVTGKRAVVYVKIPDTEKPTFQGREVVLGPGAGDFYIVKSGLAENEIVVTKGNFKIDSAMQIQAKPSMMNPKGQPAPSEHQGHNH